MGQFIVVAGGTIDDAFACRVLDGLCPAFLIAADAGAEFFFRNGRKPDLVIGDFDSVEQEILSRVREWQEVEFVPLDPVKDDTDTEAAVRLAVARGAERITVLGATGSRLDHVLANIELLGIGLAEGVAMELLDSHNRIRMVRGGMTLRREEQFGRYVSLLPYSERVEHLTLRGFRYPLTDHCLRGSCSLGVSNEIVEKEASIAFDGGILLVIEARD